MKATIKKINELVYGNSYTYRIQIVNLEMLLTSLKYYKVEKQLRDTLLIRVPKNYFIWQLNKTLTEQSEQTQQTIKNLFE
jgi:hypothetical protein